MLFAAINSGIEFGINYIPVDDDAKDWMKRANDGLAVVADVAVGGGTSTAAIVTKAVLREVGDRVVPADDKTAQQVFQAASTVAQTAAGSAGAGVANAAAASSQAAASQIAAEAGRQVASNVAQESLRQAAITGAKTVGTQVAGGAVGAGVGFAVDGTDGLQSGVEMGVAVGAGDLATAGLKAGGAAAGGAIGYMAADGDSAARLTAMRAGASVGTQAASTGAAFALGNGREASETAAALGQAAGAAGRAATGMSAEEAIVKAESTGRLASAATGLSGRTGADLVGESAALVSQTSREGLELTRDVHLANKKAKLQAALAKQGYSEELVSRLHQVGRSESKMNEASRGLGEASSLSSEGGSALSAKSLRASQLRAVLV